jgi:uncharacterized protein YbjQ (UPF0145 family)
MILTTTHSVEGYKIIEYKGIVTGTSSDIKTKFSFKTEKNLDISNDVINKAQEEAFQKLQENAKLQNANAVIGISMDLENAQGSYFFVTVIGTAVYIAK